MARPDIIEYQRRLYIIQGWIIEGCQSALMARKIIEYEWTNAKKLDDQIRSAKRMLKDAREQWIEAEDEDIDQRRLIKIAELKQIRKSLKDQYKGTPGGIRAIMSVEKEIIKLEGITPAKKIELGGKDGGPIEVNNSHSLKPEDIREIAKALEKDF